MNKFLKIILAAGFALVIAAVAASFIKPQIDVTISAPKINEAQAVEFNRAAIQLCTGSDCLTSPDGKYTILIQDVDDRDLLSRALQMSYSPNGLTRITVADNSSDAAPVQVAILRERDPGSGRSYRIDWSADSAYLTINGSVRNVQDGSNPEAQDISYLFIVDEGQLYSY